MRWFESEIQKALEQKRFKLVVNCEGLTSIASAGLVPSEVEAIRSFRDGEGAAS